MCYIWGETCVYYSLDIFWFFFCITLFKLNWFRNLLVFVISNRFNPFIRLLTRTGTETCSENSFIQSISWISATKLLFFSHVNESLTDGCGLAEQWQEQHCVPSGHLRFLSDTSSAFFTFHKHCIWQMFSLTYPQARMKQWWQINLLFTKSAHCTSCHVQVVMNTGTHEFLRNGVISLSRPHHVALLVSERSSW